MKKKKRTNKKILILLLPITMIFFNLSSFIPNCIEVKFTNGIYKLITQPISLLTGIIPFSLTEIIIVIFILFSLGKCVKLFLNIKNDKHHRMSILKQFFQNICISISLVYFFFICLWGLNYNRLTLSKIMDLEIHTASNLELIELCESLIERANLLRTQVNVNAEGIMQLKNDKSEALSKASKGYIIASEVLPELSGKYGTPKGIFLSKVLTYTGISGFYFPFTAEANVNMDIPDAMIPCTITHEMAHQRGFAREDEANFIAYLTCKLHPDPDFQYSGILLAIIHSMNELYQYNPKKYHELQKKYQIGITKDLSDLNQFWHQYEGPVEDISSNINNAYLKINRQNQGIASYSRIVDLLIAEHKKGD